MLRRDAMREQLLNEDRSRDEMLKEEENIANSILMNQMMSKNSEMDMESTRYGMGYNVAYSESERGDAHSYKTIDQCGESMNISKEILELEKKLTILRQSGTEALIKARTSPFTLSGEVSAPVNVDSATSGDEKYEDDFECQSERLRTIKRSNIPSAFESVRDRRSSYLDSTRNDSQTQRRWQREGQRTSDIINTRKETEESAKMYNWRKAGQMSSNVCDIETDKTKMMYEGPTYEDRQIHMKVNTEGLTQGDMLQMRMPVDKGVGINNEAYKSGHEIMMENDKLENASREPREEFRYSQECKGRIYKGELYTRTHENKDSRMPDYRDRRKNDVEIERERIETEIDREIYYLNQLKERNRMINDEIEIRAREEQQLAERIYELEIAQQELGNVRKEREMLEKDIERKLENEREREKNFKLMKLKEQELSKRMNNDKYTFREENIERRQGMSTQIVANFGSPRIPPFIGVDYKVWRIEVDCIINSGIYHEILISQALRSALKGDTKRILLTLDPMASSYEILRKLEDVYGTTHTEDSIMQELFNARQRQNETTSEWALRLESVMQLAVQTGDIPESKRNTLLKQRFWKGLLDDKLRNNTRVTYESEASFEILRKKTRLEENELRRQSLSNENSSKLNRATSENDRDKSTTAHFPSEGFSNQHEVMSKQMDLLKTMMSKMEKLEVEMVELRKGRKESESRESNNGGYKKGFNYNKNWPKKDEGKKNPKENDVKQSGEEKNLNR